MLGPLGVCDLGPSLTAVCHRACGARPAREAAPAQRVASPGDPSRGASSRSPRTFVPELAAKDSTWHVHFRVTPATWGSSYRRGITCYPCAPGAAGFPAAETKEREDVRNTIRALAVGITRGFLAASGIALAGLVITVITIRIRREDLAGTAEPALASLPAP